MDEINPVLLTSPTIRCGTTLLQRLLCSSSNALIYGEEIAKDLEMQLQIFTSRKMIYSHSRQRFASSLGNVLQGDTKDWIPDLMPDIDGYLEALREGAFAGLLYCRRHAAEAGRRLWGFKYPGWPPHLLQMLSDAIPGTRVIYISRHLADCVRSARARGEIDGDAQLENFCSQWIDQEQFMRQWHAQHPVLMLTYESLTRDPDLAIRQLCDFLPFENLKPDVLQHKINNMARGSDTRHPDNDYIEPAVLTAAELAYIEKRVASMAPAVS